MPAPTRFFADPWVAGAHIRKRHKKLMFTAGPRVASLVLGPWAVMQRLNAAAWRRLPPLQPALLLLDAPAPVARPPSTSLAELLLDRLLRMAVPKKKVSYTRKRKRTAGFQAVRGSKLQTHLYMCPVCERMRAPHRVCGREDCATYFKHRWF